MQLGPNIWGPHLWKALHMITMGYSFTPTEEEKKNYRTFFENFHNVIPCSICANNYKRHLKEIPLTDKVFESREFLSKWVIDVHNLVNKEKGKKVLSYDEAFKLIYENFDNTDEQTSIQINDNTKKTKDSDDNKFYPLWVLIVILVILVMIAIIYKKN